MKFIRYFLLACLLYAVAFQNAAAQPVNSYLKQDKFTTQISDTLYVYFKVGKTDIVPSFMGNSTTLNTFDRFLIDYSSPRFMYTLQGITLQGSASPEGKAHWNRILANRRADAISKYIKNEHSVNQQLVKKDDVTINHGAHYTQWPQLRSTQIIVVYERVSKDEPLPQGAGAQLGMVRVGTKSVQSQLEYVSSIENSANWEEANKEVANWKESSREENESRNFRIALKTNALYDILLTPNIGVEIPVYGNWSVAANWMYAWWKADPSSWYHRIYGGDIEVRRYIKQWPWSKANGTGNTSSPLTGWHVGAYAQMLTYDFEWGGTGYLGDKWSCAAGAAVGYSKNIAKNLNLDFTLGVGYLTGEYMEYKPIDNCYVWQATKQRHWIGPTKAEVSLVWLLGRW